jgi:hypothetical protein
MHQVFADDGNRKVITAPDVGDRAGDSILISHVFFLLQGRSPLMNTRRPKRTPRRKAMRSALEVKRDSSRSVW